MTRALQAYYRRKAVYKVRIMDHKNIVATIYLKDGEAVKGLHNFEPAGDLFTLASLYNDSGIDKILIFDLSTSDEEHEKNIHTIKEINRNVEIPVCGGGNINRLEDIKKLLYAGCKQVMLNGSKLASFSLAKEGGARFGKEHINVSIKNVDFVFKHQSEMLDYFHEMLLMDSDMVDAVENVTDLPFVVQYDVYEHDKICDILKQDCVRGVAGAFINDPEADIMKIKAEFSRDGLTMDHFEPAVKWEALKKNSDDMVPVIVQDYRTDEVLMLAYMTKEAFDATISSGKMTYYSRSRGELWVKGETSGHIQYVKSLTADCDYDTILAKVSQVGVACHTGKPSCFFNEIVKKDYVEKNPRKVFEDVYGIISDRKKNPKDGSYTNYLFEKGIDKILKKVGEEATEIVIAAKNPDAEEIKYEISDFLYHVMVLMVEKGVTWEDITQELAQR